MNIVRTTNITVNNNGFMPMGGMLGGPTIGFNGGMLGPSVFGCGFGFGGMLPPNNDVAAGMCTGMAAGWLLRTPGALKTVGKVIAWPFKMIGKGATFVWNKAIKPAAQWTYNKILKPIGQWIGGLFHSKKSSKTEKQS